MEYTQDDYENDFGCAKFIFLKYFKKFERFKDDLIQCAVIALWKNRDNYDSSKCSLSTYRFNIARYAMLRYFVVYNRTNRKINGINQKFVSFDDIVPGTDNIKFAESIEGAPVDFDGEMEKAFLEKTFDEAISTYKVSKNNNYFFKICELIKQGKNDATIARELGCTREMPRLVRNKVKPLFLDKLREYEYLI